MYFSMKNYLKNNRYHTTKHSKSRILITDGHHD